MGFLILKVDEKSRQSIIRAIKTIFFLVTMMISLLVFSAPVLLAVADAILPSALLSASGLSPPSSTPTTTAAAATATGGDISSTTSREYYDQYYSSIGSFLSSHLQSYDFRYSLFDIPLLSIVRSIVILCVYSCCDGPGLSRGPYLWVATACSAASLVFVSLKASFVFGKGQNASYGISTNGAEVALFCCSYALAVAHVVVAYRTSCRERKKLLVYKIDIEAVSACKNAFPSYQKKLLLRQERKR